MAYLNQHAHDGAFTVVVCQAPSCESASDPGLVDALRATVRHCPHGVLVTTGCVLGTLACRSSVGVPGGIVVVQPCGKDRRPQGAAIWVGPVRSGDDTRALCWWLEHGDLRGETLPHRIRYAARAALRATAN